MPVSRFELKFSVKYSMCCKGNCVNKSKAIGEMRAEREGKGRGG